MTPLHTQKGRPIGLDIAVGFSALALAGLLGAAPGADEESPHGVPVSCTSCHDGGAEDAALGEMSFTRGSSDAGCLHCHEDGPHEVGMEPVLVDDGTGEHAKLPETWPLADGRVACLTCHDEPACDGAVMDPDNRFFLRGGPYGTIGEFCASCHTVEQLGSYNPHQDMKDRPDSKSICEFCHQDATVTEADMDDLKVAAPRMCEGCHREVEMHASSAEHLVALDAEGIERAEAAGLPLDQGTVYCGTCHDPHPAGSIEQDSARAETLGGPLMPPDWAREVLHTAMDAREVDLGDETLGTTEPDYLRLPLGDGQLCKACHLPADVDAGLLEADQ